MSVLVLRLAAPLQSWGAASRFTRRATESMPTKSGIIGLLAAAEGRRRSDPIEDLLGIELAVRTEQQGTLLRDFHTAHHQVTGTSMPLTERFYWSDAVFTAYIGADASLLEGLADALRDPAYPLFFGRRSCVPVGPIVLPTNGNGSTLRSGSVAEAVRNEPWQAGYAGRKAAKSKPTIRLSVQADQSVFPDVLAGRELNDVPLSFDPERRQYGSRMVVETSVVVETGEKQELVAAGPHDPMAAALGGSL